ncbi:hypothetical protein ACFWVF_24010 [Streptomyces sp. NPDC058659]|uniref:hypothetical protein n=1 Tax=unclassified Streptomyces TaxID=2593676 RepID=UPI003649E764
MAALGWTLTAEGTALAPGGPVRYAADGVVTTPPAMRLAVKLGFTEVERFEEYGAEQWFGVWSPVTPND